MKRLLFFIIPFSLILSGCTTWQRNSVYSGSCDFLLFKPLHANLDLPLTSEEATALVESYYGVQPEDVKIKRIESNDSWSDYIEWEDQDIHYIVVISKGDLEVINVSSEKGKISAGKLVECVGHQPEWYRALYGPRMERSGIDYEFELWFPSAGITSKSVKYAPNPEKIRALTPKFEVERIDIVSPGPLDEVSKRAYIAHLPPSDPYGEVQRELQPWPGDWQEIEFVQGW